MGRIRLPIVYIVTIITVNVGRETNRPTPLTSMHGRKKTKLILR